MDPLWETTANKVPRKVKFAPKAPPKKEKKPILPKVEKTEEDIDNIKAEQLLRRLHESSLSGKPKVEKKVAATKVAFGYGGSSSTLKSYGAHKGINKIPGLSSDGGAEQIPEKEYKEPWDYYTYYPVTLPLRRPYSGNPELLDEQEFDVDPERSAYDENETNSAAELGLLDEDTENNMFLLKFPANLPTMNPSVKTEAEANEPENSEKGTAKPKPTKPCNLEALPPGFMGKMLVYKSGAIKLKLGDILYDVSAGLNSVFAQEVVAVNAEDKHCCNMGEIHKRAVITPDIDSMLDAMSDS